MPKQLKGVGGDGLTAGVSDEQTGRRLIDRFTSLHRPSSLAAHNATEYGAELANKPTCPLARWVYVRRGLTPIRMK